MLATTPVALDPGSTVDAVMLPAATGRGVMHVFDVGTAPVPAGTPAG